MKTPTVILLSSSADAVGVSTHVFELARVLNENGLLDTVVCPKNGWLPEQLAKNNIPFTVLDISYQLTKFIPSSLNLAKFLQTKAAKTIVHLHGRFPLFIALYSLLLRRDLRFALTIHQFTSASSHGRFKWKLRLETYLLRYMRGICCVSHDLQNEVIARVGKEKHEVVTTIPNWIRPLWYSDRNANIGRRRITTSEVSVFKLCAIGRLSHAKGFDVLVKSISILTRSGMNVKCDIYGDGEDRVYLERLVQTLGLDEQICFKGSVGDVRLRLPNYSILVVPSRTESFGLVVLEAYDASVPVVASCIPGLTSIVVGGKTGILFESGSPNSLAEGIKDVLQERVDVDLLVNNAYQTLRRHTPDTELVNKYKKFYMQVSM